MNAQRGFTLIELVVVIIVLGLLAVTAAPKFIDLQTDARKATLQGAKGALQSANALVYAKAGINNDLAKDCTANPKPAGCTDIDMPGTSVDVTPVFGSLDEAETQITAATDLSTDEWDFTVASGVMYITADGTAAVTTGVKTSACQLEYTPATSSVAAKYIIEDDGC